MRCEKVGLASVARLIEGSADTGAPMAQLTSSGVAIAGHTVFVAATGSGNEGYVVAYRPAG